jgi:hypothetical protein
VKEAVTVRIGHSALQFASRLSVRTRGASITSVEAGGAPQASGSRAVPVCPCVRERGPV